MPYLQKSAQNSCAYKKPPPPLHISFLLCTFAAVMLPAGDKRAGLSCHPTPKRNIV